MAYKLDKSALQTLFEGIRDERRLQANTANRIGNAFLSLLHFCADETSEAFLSRKHDDAAEGMITFLRGLISEQMAQLKAGAQFGDFVSGLYNGKARSRCQRQCRGREHHRPHIHAGHGADCQPPVSAGG